MNLIKPHINPKNNKIHKFKEIRVCRVCKINEKVCYKRSTKEYICWSCANKQRTFIKKPIGYNYGPNQGYSLLLFIGFVPDSILPEELRWTAT